MKVELRNIIDILRREIKPGSPIADRIEMKLGVVYCVKLLTKINDEGSKDVGKYLSLTRALPDDYPRERDLMY